MINIIEFLKRNILPLIFIIIVGVTLTGGFYYLQKLQGELIGLREAVDTQQQALIRTQGLLYTSSKTPNPPPSNTNKEPIKSEVPVSPLSQNPEATASACNCPAGPAGPKGEKGDKGDKGDSATTLSGQWVSYCQSALGPVRKKPAYGCDTGNTDLSHREEEVILFVK